MATLVKQTMGIDGMSCAACAARIERSLRQVAGVETADVNFALLLRRRHQILGLVMRSRPLEDKIAITQRFVRDSLSLFADRRLSPVLDRIYPLSEAASAHEYMEQNQNIGKIVLRVGA